jgi:hypothetical protein
MSKYTVKSSTVFVSVDDETRVFRSVDEVPPEWRRRFERPKGGLKPQTILIADRKGKEEIMRSLQGRPSSVTTRWKAGGSASPASSARQQQQSQLPGSVASKGFAARLSVKRVLRGHGPLRASQQLWIEAGFVIALAGLIYSAFLD